MPSLYLPIMKRPQPSAIPLKVSLSLLFSIHVLCFAFIISVGQAQTFLANTPSLTDNNIQARIQRWMKDPEGSAADYGHISDWDTSNITSMRFLFDSSHRFKEDLSRWQVSRVTDFTGIFRNCTVFDGNLEKWDVTATVTMECMFCDAESFRGRGLTNWARKLGNVQSMYNMFRGTNLQEGKFMMMHDMLIVYYVWL